MVEKAAPFHQPEESHADTQVAISRCHQPMAADAKSTVLAPYELNDADWNAYLARRKSRERVNVPVPAFVEVRGTGGEATKELESYLQPLVGKPVDTTTTNSILNRLTGTGRYDSADFWLAEDESRTGLIVNMHEKSCAPPILQLGFNVDGSEPDLSPSRNPRDSR